MVLLMTNKKIMTDLLKWHLTIDQLALLVNNVLIYMYLWRTDHLTKQLTNMQVKTYNLTYLGQYDFLMA